MSALLGFYLFSLLMVRACVQFEWRNGWFYAISKRALDSGKEDPCPLHTAWLREVGAIKA